MTQKARRGRMAEPKGPVSPEALAIARLASRGGESEKARQSPTTRAAVGSIRVQLYRPLLEVDDEAMHFRLKMALLKGLRRRFRYSLIDIDDADRALPSQQPFTIEVESDDDAAAGQARAVVERVLRWRRWRDA
ncbi:MAG: hypothetical protein PVI87_07545 [Gammaproteobacteria bacterium]